MFSSTFKARKINSFTDVNIPKPVELFARYGERIGVNGYGTTADDTESLPVQVNGGSTIDQCINGQQYFDEYGKIIEPLDKVPSPIPNHQ